MIPIKSKAKYEIFLWLTVFWVNGLSCQISEPGFVYVTDIIPTIKVELRYFSANNFMGERVDGYEREKCILSIEATKSLYKVQQELMRQDLSLKIFDAYRPQKAVNHFIRWAEMASDTLMKKMYYPSLDKKNLFKLGYISSRSGHSRGSTIDLTIIRYSTGEELDMGSPYDFFGEISHHSFDDLSALQKQNREKLKKSMEKYGFRSYSKEWWHYTLNNEPFMDRYFDFDIK